jgi:hypothetical protein
MNQTSRRTLALIIVADGPSAAGKATWTERHCDPAIVVAETTAAESVAAPGQREHAWALLHAIQGSSWTKRSQATHGADKMIGVARMCRMA